MSTRIVALLQTIERHLYTSHGQTRDANDEPAGECCMCEEAWPCEGILLAREVTAALATLKAAEEKP